MVTMSWLMRLQSVSAKTSWTVSAVVALGSAAVTARKRGAGAAVLVGSVVVGTQLADYLLDAVRREAQVRRARDAREAERLRHLASDAVKGTSHDPMTVISRSLDAAGVTGRGRNELDIILAELRSIADAFAEESGGLAARYERAEGPLDRFGASDKVQWAPKALQPVLTQAGELLDEVRLLHGSEIEYAALLYTFAARAIVLIVAPTLGRVSAVPAPLSQPIGARDVAWGVASAWSAAIALAGPQVAELTMDRGDSGARARRWLLRIETPIAITSALLCPSWTVMIFATGWTNFWQRPGPDFYPKRLIAYIATMVAAQATGLRLARIRTGSAVVEAVASWAMIGFTGDSYGAMLPMSAMTVVRVLVSEQSRKARSAALGQGVLARAARAVRDLADEIERESADPTLVTKLREQAQVLAGADHTAPTNLQELVHDAIEISEALLDVRAPSFSSQDLRAGVLRDQKVADALSAAIARCHTEAIGHGHGRVYTDLRLRGGRIEVTVQNDIDRESPPGMGEGQRLLRRIVELELPAGELDEPGAEEEEGARTGMWTVRFSFSSDALAN